VTTRDRTVIIVVALAVLLGGTWLKVVSPKRQEASKLTAQVASAKAELATAESQLSDARGAQNKYATAYASIVNLGKAVPPTEEVPSLIYEIAQASNQKQVDFSSIATSTSASASTASAPGAASTFTQLPFTLTFNGGFFELEHVFRKLTNFTRLNAPGQVAVNGRLLTVASVKLSPASGSGPAEGNSGQLTGTITATAYVLPASQGLTAGASPSSPSAAGSTPAASGSSSSPTTPAIVKANP
jgi:Tfp pilus assembly protein PilO